MSYKRPWGQGCRGTAARHVLRGCGRILLVAKYNENRAFHHKAATVARYNRLLFQLLMRQIRYSADQWNFFADQRILHALTIE